MISLRRATADDVDFLVGLVNGDDTRRFLGNRVSDTREAVLADLAKPPAAFGWFVIEADGERAGCVAFELANEEHRIAKLGRFAIDPRFRERRIGVEDLGATLARLKEQGIEPEREPYRVREGGSLLCFVLDPDGYRIEVIGRGEK